MDVDGDSLGATMNKNFDNFFNQIIDSDEFAVESAKLEFAIELRSVMDRERLTNSELADRLGVSRPMVSKLLRGDGNLTIETMVKASRHVDGKLFIRIVRNGCSARLFELAQSEKPRLGGGYRLPSLTSPAPGSTDVWLTAANDLHNVELGYEAKPLAA